MDTSYPSKAKGVNLLTEMIQITYSMSGTNWIWIMFVPDSFGYTE